MECFQLFEHDSERNIRERERWIYISMRTLHKAPIVDHYNCAPSHSWEHRKVSFKLLQLLSFELLWISCSLTLFSWLSLLALFRFFPLNFLFFSFVSVASPPATPPSITASLRGASPLAPSFSLSAVPCRTSVTVFPFSAELGCLRPSPIVLAVFIDHTSSPPALQTVVRHAMSPGRRLLFQGHWPPMPYLPLCRLALLLHLPSKRLHQILLDTRQT